MLLEPDHIWIVWRGKLIGNFSVEIKRRHRAIIPPALEFSMAIHERKSASPMMIAAGQVVKSGLFGMVRPTGHVRGEIAPVDAVLAHIQKQKSSTRARIKKFIHFQV